MAGTRKGRINRNEPKPRPIRPACPRWLSKEAQQEWKRVAPELEYMGLLTAVDGPAFAGLCSALALARKLEGVTDWRGLTAWQKAWTLARQFATEFGMTPSSRSRLTITPPTDEAESSRMLD